ncbi:uncharacterized protein LOC114847053 isoform X2 [Betta splendens]|nr:uncharacterized protein LOC114847053 isoform X2 [Betta splendens]
MSCGHAVTPDSLTLWCRSQLQKGIYQFKCPAITEGVKQCNKPWSYQEVRRLADLSVDEMQEFEDRIAHLAAAQSWEIQPCPQCNTSVERKDVSNLCVRCPVRSADQKETHQFCWQCLKPWKGPGPRSDRCDNDGCVDEYLQLPQTCGTVSLPAVTGASRCPAVRACPTCGVKVEHSRQNCKNVACRRCHVAFCFVCLKLKSGCIQTSSPYETCPGGAAPRQTSVPAWKGK